MKGQWAQEMMEKKERTRKVLDRDGIVGVYAAGLVLQILLQNSALCHRAKHMCVASEQLRERWDGGRSSCCFLPMR